MLAIFIRGVVINSAWASQRKFCMGGGDTWRRKISLPGGQGQRGEKYRHTNSLCVVCAHACAHMS